MASGRFATFCYARIDAGARRIVYSNAGHNPPILVHASGQVERLTEGGMVLGVFPDNAYEQAALSLASGDRLLFFTDGISEARNPDGDEYGEERIGAVAASVREQGVEAIKDAVLADVNSFSHNQFEDDATLIVVGVP
jgi:sigma-B regulation protein RsbU (phosphoserine phosphatase)